MHPQVNILRASCDHSGHAQCGEKAKPSQSPCCHSHSQQSHWHSFLIPASAVNKFVFAISSHFFTFSCFSLVISPFKMAPTVVLKCCLMSLSAGAVMAPPWGGRFIHVTEPTAVSTTWVNRDALHAVSLKKKHRKQSYVLIGGQRCEKGYARTLYSPKSRVSGHGCSLQWCYRTHLPQIIRIAFEHLVPWSRAILAPVFSSLSLPLGPGTIT